MSIKTDIERGLTFKDTPYSVDIQRGMVLRFETYPDPCDNRNRLTRVEFTNYNTAGLPMDWVTLRGRTYEEIVKEVEFHIRRTYEFIAEHYCNNIRNGHR